MAAFVLNVHDIGDSGKDYTFELSSAWAADALRDTGLAAAAASVGTLEVHASRSGTDILVQGSLRAQLTAECGRCLGPATVTVSTPIATLFSPRGEGRPARQSEEDLDLTPDELARESFSGDKIVLDELVRDQLIVEVPMQPLCSDACTGIDVPPSVKAPDDFGRGEDPRLAPLKALRDQHTLGSRGRDKE
jgi:uncharacterized protein